MMTINIPGFKNEVFHPEHLVLDFNGTLAIDGKLIPRVGEKLLLLSDSLQLHVVTGNTFHTAEQELAGIPCRLTLLPPANQSEEKEKYVRKLGAEKTIAIGNGRNDRAMLRVCAIGIILLQKEGAGIEAFSGADILCRDIFDALDLISNPKRMVATLRG